MNSLGTGLLNPNVQFFDDLGEELAAGTVTTYLAGTTTPVATFADAELTDANANPLTLDAAGRGIIYFDPVNGGVEAVSYKIVVKDSLGATVYTQDDISVPAPSANANLTTAVIGYGEASTLTISGGAVTPVRNVHILSPESGSADNLDTLTVDELPNGALLLISNSNGSAAITVRNNGGGSGNIYTQSGSSVVLNTTAKRMLLARYGANWFEIAPGSSSSGGGGGGGVTISANSACDGRLTLTTGVPVTTSDVTAATTLYYTPYVGNYIDLYTGTAWERLTFSELSIAVPATASTMYDVFAYNNAGTVTLELTAWTNITTRATAIVRQNGVYCKTGALTRRYLGSFATTGVSGTTEDSLTLRYVWNYYNRVSRVMRRLETANSWTYSTLAYRVANNSALNLVTACVGVAEDLIHITVRGHVTSSDSTVLMYVSIGVDSVTASDTAVLGQTSGSVVAGDMLTPSATLHTYPGIGLHYYAWLEAGAGVGTQTWYGDNGTPTLIQSGMWGTVIG